MGSCWGIQMAAVVAGGVIAKNPKGREWGIAKAITIREQELRNWMAYIKT